MKRPPLRRFISRVAIYGFLGAVVSLAIGFALAVWVDPRQGTSATSSAFDGEARWTATVWARPGAVYVQSDRDSSWPWSPRQATGAPDTTTAADNRTAWAANTSSNSVEWLELTYGKAIVPKEVHVHETYNPGALFKVTAFDPAGREVIAWEGSDPTPAGSGLGMSKVATSVNFATNRIRVYVDSRIVTGWNEIDAVALVGPDGKEIWAERARASSGYSVGPISPGVPAVESLIPAWTGLRQPGPAFAAGTGTGESRAVAAFGWPFLVVYGGQDLTAAAAVSPGASLTASSIYLTNTAVPLQSSGRMTGLGYGGGSTTIMPPSGLSGAWASSGTVVLSGPSSGFTALVSPGSSPSAGPTPIPAPRRVLWAGLLLNAAIFGVVLFLLRLALVKPRRFFVEVSRLRNGRCIACGYDLGYDFIRGCPECGWRRVGVAGAAAKAKLKAGSNGRGTTSEWDVPEVEASVRA
jgi:hypothetical protein